MPRKPKEKEKEIEKKDKLTETATNKRSSNSKKIQNSEETPSSKLAVTKSTKTSSNKTTKSSKLAKSSDSDTIKESSEADVKKTPTSDKKQAKSTKDNTSIVSSKETLKTKKPSKKEAKLKFEKDEKTKDAISSKTSNSSKKSSSNKTNAKTKTTTRKKTEASKTSAKKSSTTKRATTKSKSTTKRKVEILEYYDLPYRYNQTIVKVLAQTPTTLFVYWDISDSDRENLVNKYGEKFFEETKPVLIIHNETNNYSFEVEINDFANSWYLHISDSKCVYTIELGRKPINQNNQSVTSIPQNYIYITSSNEMEAPNDHILFDSLGDTVYFRNVKTNIIEGKKITSLSFIQNIGKIYNIYDIYQKIYPAENIKYFDLNNPSSGNPSSFFK